MGTITRGLELVRGGFQRCTTRSAYAGHARQALAPINMHLPGPFLIQLHKDIDSSLDYSCFKLLAQDLLRVLCD